jgi:predicted RNase H-like HicB family nuclease
LEKENAIHAITLYAEKEREEIEKNPEKFVKPAEEGGNKA